MTSKSPNELSTPTLVGTSDSRKSKKNSLKGLAKSIFRTSSKIKTKRTSSSSSSRAASAAMNSNGDETNVTKNTFLVEDSNSSSSTSEGFEFESDSDYGLDLVVLLMHPISHRFELLQLEFDTASKAKISDLLAQIPLSITEDCLKDQLYDAILDQNSSDKGRPLLVLKSTKLVEAFGRKKQKSANANSEKKPSHKMVLVARPQGLSNEDALKMAKPIFTNKDIATMLALSGFDVKPWKKKKFLSRTSVSLAKEFENMPSSEDGNFQNSSTSHGLLGLVYVMVISMVLHSIMVTPTQTDFVMKPGSYSSKCGLYGFVPMKKAIQETAKTLFDTELFSCQDEFLRINSDGTATLYDSERKAVMILKGGVCGSKESCVNGLVMKGSDRSLEMGGKPVRQVLVRRSNKNKKLSWPFEEAPTKLKYKTGSKNDFP